MRLQAYNFHPQFSTSSDSSAATSLLESGSNTFTQLDLVLENNETDACSAHTSCEQCTRPDCSWCLVSESKTVHGLHKRGTGVYHCTSVNSSLLHNDVRSTIRGYDLAGDYVMCQPKCVDHTPDEKTVTWALVLLAVPIGILLLVAFAYAFCGFRLWCCDEGHNEFQTKQIISDDEDDEEDEGGYRLERGTRDIKDDGLSG